jgi:hypothetical protein
MWMNIEEVMNYSVNLYFKVGRKVRGVGPLFI